MTTSITTSDSFSFFSSLSSVSSSSSSPSYCTTVTGTSSFPTSSNYSSNSNLHKGAIVGGVVGGGAAVIVIVIAIVVYSSKRRPEKQFSRVFHGDRNSVPNEPRLWWNVHRGVDDIPDRAYSVDAETSSPSREELDVGEQEHVSEEIPPTYESLVPQTGGPGIRNKRSGNVMRGGSRSEGGVGGNE
ncbi:hypothetical protein GG344DRAFT_66018 [Lentinula edodes]|nr:hypothetical protein GG344DRAFT_66018 [Lentinula edodes]